MSKIKLCGLSRPEDILAANELRPDYIGFVFAPKSRRYVSPGQAAGLKAMLDPNIQAVGVFVDEDMETIAGLLMDGVIDIAQLHGSEDDDVIAGLRKRTGRPIIKAFRIGTETDIARANESAADMVLLDAGAGEGAAFDWKLLRKINRPYFLAGGLNCGNITEAVRTLEPYGVDVSSGIETDGKKDRQKIAAFAAGVRKEDKE